MHIVTVTIFVLRQQGCIQSCWLACWKHVSGVAGAVTGRTVLQALRRHGSDIGIAFSGAEDVALVEYAHLTGRPYRVFRSSCNPPLAGQALLLDYNVWDIPHRLYRHEIVGLAMQFVHCELVAVVKQL